MYAEISTNSKTRLPEENNWALYTVYYIFYKLLPPVDEDIVIDFEAHILLLIWTMLCGPMQSVQQLATGWTVRRSNSGGGEFTAHLQTEPGGHLAPVQRVLGLSLGSKAMKAWR